MSNSYDIFVCRQCEGFATRSKNLLKSHQLTHVKCKTAANYNLVTSFLHEDVKHAQNNHWKEGLLYLSNHTIPQPEFRSTLITQINFRLEREVLRACHTVLECCVEAAKTHVNNNSLCDCNPTPIWLLAFVFERLVLSPNQDPTCSINQKVHQRLRLFKSSQISLLFQMSKTTTSKPPREQHDSPNKVSRAAQIALDNNNFGTANARLTSTLPVALINDSNIIICRDLHPESLNLPPPITNSRTTRSHSNTAKNLHVTPHQIMSILHSLNIAKAAGNELDSLDIFIKLAALHRRYQSKSQKSFVKTDILASFFSLVIQGNLPPRIAKILRTTYMVALCKSETDPTKLRPLGIPSAIRRVAAKTILHMFRTRFAQHLLPFNFAFGVNGGIDLIISTMRIGIDRYIAQPEARGQLPSRVLLSLYIKNMFNAILRQKLREIVATDFPELEPFVNMLYEFKGLTMVKLEDGEWEVIIVKEGFSQGCPLSPIFAGTVLNHILRKLDKIMLERAYQRQKQTTSSLALSSDDGRGSIPIVMGYMDDVNSLVSVHDVAFFVHHF